MGNGADYKPLQVSNENEYGIPQGVPMSDLLANAYLIEFDKRVSEYAKSKGGKCWRYSDDIVLVLPGNESVGLGARDFVTTEIVKYGPELRAKNEKTSIVEFSETDDGNLSYRPVSGARAKNGFKYLGFRFDGKAVYLRNSTLANFHRKITWRARRQARNHVARYQGKSVDWLMENFDFGAFENRFGRVRDFESVTTMKKWTFWTYARRASERFGKQGMSILKQVKGYRRQIRQAVEVEILKQLGESAKSAEYR